jgi:hypothetical protein
MTNPGQEGWSGVDLNGTGISMYPAPAEKMMIAIANILTAARDGWTAANGKIEGLEGKLGEGPLGEPFRKQYNPAAKELTKSINEMVEQLRKLSESGTKAPPLYVNADFQAGQNFEF